MSHPPSARQQADETLSRSLRQVHRASRQTYGSLRLLAALRQQGHRTSRRRVRQHRLHTVAPRRFVPQTTDSRHDQPLAPNRLAQAPAPTGPNQVWVGDITYVPTQEGWLYVAAVLDRWSRRVVGLAMAGHMESSLVAAALTLALHQRQPAAGCVHHLRPGQPIRQRHLSAAGRGGGVAAQHEPARQLLRQRGDGILLGLAQDRAGASTGVCQPG